MWVEVDLKTDDVNFCGELLRKRVFEHKKEWDLGCYSTFEVQRGYKQGNISDQKYKFLWRYIYGLLSEGEDAEWEMSVTKVVENDYFIAAWYWDGDGTLVIYSKEDNVIFENSDCKKTNYWVRYECSKDVYTG